MIILIAGDTHTGKTNLAQKLLEHYKIPYVSIDHLKMGLIRSGNTDLTPESDDDTLTEKLWPVVREMIKTCIENNQSLIVEGCYIPWDWKKDFTEEEGKSISYLCLKYHLDHICIDDKYEVFSQAIASIEKQLKEGSDFKARRNNL